MGSSGEEKELDKLRKTIEEFRAKAERSGQAIPESKSANSTPQADSGFVTCDSSSWSGTSACSAPTLSSGRHFDSLSPNSTIGKRISSGSISSMSSHASHSSVSSSSSGGSAESDLKHKKRRWLPLKSAFSRGSRSHSSGGNEFVDHDDSGCLLSPTSSRRVYRNTGHGSLDSSIYHASYNEILQIVQDKERKLTDVRLEALTSQHQLHQLQDQIAQMQHEMQLLRMENERLRNLNPNCDAPNSLCNTNISFQVSPITNMPPPHQLGSATEGDRYYPLLNTLDCYKLYQSSPPGNDDEGKQMKFVVLTPTSIDMPTQFRPPTEIQIASVPVSRQINWGSLDKLTGDLFTEYCRCVDGENRFGLVASSITFYKVGEQTRVPGTTPPELLPCAFIVGNVETIEISLQDAFCGSVDLMSFRSLIPKTVLLRYVNAMLPSKLVMLHGPSGTGKSTLAYCLADHLVSRERRPSHKSNVSVFDVKQRGEEDLKSYLKSVSERINKAEQQIAFSNVIIVENCYLLTSLQETFAPIINQCGKANCPYVIGTMLPCKSLNEEGACKGIARISCSNNSLHVKDYLSRKLRKSVVDHEVTGNETSEEEFENMLRVITWLPLCWHHINRCLEKQNAKDVAIGPRIFTSCPCDFIASCTWFVQAWNHVIVPYVIAAIRKIRYSQNDNNDEKMNRPQWEDPTEWVMESFPWNESEVGCDHSLRLKRILSDELDCPPVPPRPDVASSRKTSNTKHMDHRVILNDSSESSRLEGHLVRKDSYKCQNKGRNNPPVPPMELMQDRGSTTVWHKHNSPLTSPTKTVIHAGGSRNPR